MTAWGEGGAQDVSSPRAHYDAGVTAMTGRDHLTALCHFAAGLLLLHIDRS